MDLNTLYHRHGVSYAMAEHAGSKRSRESHRALAKGFADRIERELRANRGAEG
jgi:hypothetical protein